MFFYENKKIFVYLLYFVYPTVITADLSWPPAQDPP